MGLGRYTLDSNPQQYALSKPSNPNHQQQYGSGSQQEANRNEKFNIISNDPVGSSRLGTRPGHGEYGRDPIDHDGGYGYGKTKASFQEPEGITSME